MVNHLAELVSRGETVVWSTKEMDQEEMDAVNEIEKGREDGEVRDGDAELKPTDDQGRTDHIAKRVKREVTARARATATTNRHQVRHDHQRGFVTTGGNADTTARLITLLRFLRHEYGITLPVEIWTFPGELARDSSQYSEIVELGGQVLEVPSTYGINKDNGAWKNFQIKGLAIALSSFKELVYLDSDNIPLRDPTYLFDTPSYTAEGSGKAVFWPDLSKDHVDNAVWRVMGVPCDLNDFTFESGQIVIDKVSETVEGRCSLRKSQTRTIARFVLQAGSNGLNMAALHLAAYMQHEKDFWFRLCGVSRAWRSIPTTVGVSLPCPALVFVVFRETRIPL